MLSWKPPVHVFRCDYTVTPLQLLSFLGFMKLWTGTAWIVLKDAVLKKNQGIFSWANHDDMMNVCNKPPSISSRTPDPASRISTMPMFWITAKPVELGSRLWVTRDFEETTTKIKGGFLRKMLSGKAVDPTPHKIIASVSLWTQQKWYQKKAWNCTINTQYLVNLLTQVLT